MRQNFGECERRVQLSEGGYTNDPRDPGGPTNHGVTLHDARAHWKPDATAEDVRAMPLAVADRIFKDKYWDALRCDDLPSGVDYAVYDYGINSGIGRSGRVLRAVLGLPGGDYHVDEGVLEALGHVDHTHVVHAICDEREAFLKRLPTYDHFGAGWDKRVASVRLYSDHLAAADVGTQAPEHPSDASAGKAYAPEDHPIDVTPVPQANPPQPGTISGQGTSVVRQNEPTATQVAPAPKTHWWKPWAALGLGGSGTLDWLSQANDYADQLSVARGHLQNFHFGSAIMWVIEHPIVFLPFVLVGIAAWLWEDHKKTKRLIEELEERQCSHQ